jgi:hypothetical protein
LLQPPVEDYPPSSRLIYRLAVGLFTRLRYRAARRGLK